MIEHGLSLLFWGRSLSKEMHGIVTSLACDRELNIDADTKFRGDITILEEYLMASFSTCVSPFENSFRSSLILSLFHASFILFVHAITLLRTRLNLCFVVVFLRREDFLGMYECDFRLVELPLRNTLSKSDESFL